MALAVITAACAGLQGEATNISADESASCQQLADTRRAVVRRLDAVEGGRAVANSSGALFTVAAFISGNPLHVGMLNDAQDKAAQKALTELRTSRSALDRQIDDRRCTVESRARAGVVKMADGPADDGVYIGKASGEGWCVQPTLSLSIRGGRVGGELREAGSAMPFQVQGQVYEGGEVALSFKRPESQFFTDDFDGRLVDGTLSFVAKLDTSPRGCTLRFALARAAVAPPAPAPAEPWAGGVWRATLAVIEERSAVSCSRTAGTYVLKLAGDRLTVENSFGRLFAATIAADGAIKQTFGQYEMSGNVRHKDLVVRRLDIGCAWKLTPLDIRGSR